MDKPKRRKLPDWMSVTPDNTAAAETTDGKPSFDLIKHLEDSLPTLEFTKSPVYSYNKDDCSLLCDDILERLTESSADCFVGFDIEWPVLYRRGEESKTAVMQLCFSEKSCYVFQLSSMGVFPEMLKKLLFCPRLKLLGVGIEKCSVVTAALLLNKDLYALPQVRLLRHKLNKDPSVRTGDWRQCPLSEMQLLYAATDAFACLKIYHELLEREQQKS